MNSTILFTSLILLLFLIFQGYFVFLLNKLFNKKTKIFPSQINPSGLNFDKDILFLKFYIEFIFKYYKEHNFDILNLKKEPKRSTNNSSNIYEEFLEKMCVDVILGLSDNYKLILSMYFTESSLEDYIIKNLLELYYSYDLNITVNKMNIPQEKNSAINETKTE